METICRLVRVLQCPHECGHALVISQGSPGMSTSLAQLAAHLCGYSVFRINSSALSAADRYTMESFKADLVSAYTRAGVKVKLLFFCFFFCFFFQDMKTFFNVVMIFSTFQVTSRLPCEHPWVACVTLLILILASQTMPPTFSPLHRFG